MNPKSYFKASLQALDHEIGRLFDSLAVHNQLDNTDIIFIGDNGNTIQTAQIANTARAKGTIYQYGVHVPFIISGPSVVNPGRASDALVNTTDLFATILDLFGYTNWPSQIPLNKPVDSKSILPVLKNESTIVRPWAFTEIFKVTTDGDDGKAIRNMDYKLLRFDDGHEEFYNLTTDPGEVTNLMLGTLNAVQATNYLYLCNEMSTLVGSGSFCNPAITPPLIAATTATPVACFGNASGSINLTVSAGNQPYTFNWGNGITTQNRTGLVAGTYTVTITDVTAHTATQTTTITQPAAALTSVASTVPVACFENTTGSIQLSVTGGTSGYSFLWNDGNTTQSRTGLTAGTYSVTVADAHNCTASISQVIIQPAAPLTAAATTTAAGCFGNATGSIQLSATGGTSGYSFLWSDGNTTQNHTDLIAGTYSATVTDFHNCTTSISQVITQPATPLKATATTTAAGCFGNATGNIQLSAAGGTSGYSFLWNDGNTTQNHTDLTAGTYSVTVTDANNCTTSISEVITQPVAPLAAAALTTPVACFGNATGTIQLIINGGTPGTMVEWNDSSTALNRVDLPAGTYSVTVTDANNCTTTISAGIGQPDALSALSTAVDAACGESNGTITLTPTGGTLPYSFMWSNGNTTQNLSGIYSGTYTVTITDANACILQNTSNISNMNGPNASATATPVRCFGNATGAIALNIAGGTPPFSYHWNDGAITRNRTDLLAGNYWVTILDSNNCTTIISETIVQPGIITLAGAATPATCGQNNGIVALQVDGGMPSYTFNWSNGATTQYLSGIPAATYTVVVTDANDCTAVYYANIVDMEGPMVFAAATPVNCFGDATGAIQLTVSSGTPPYTYDWSNGAAGPNPAGLFAGDYAVTISDANGCTSHISQPITQPLPLAIDLVATGSIDSQSGAIMTTIIGGTSPYALLWNTGDTVQLLQNLAPGNYTVTLTDTHGCTTTGNTIVTSLSAVENEPNSMAIQIYPNPGAAMIMVQSRKILEHTLYLKLTTIAGQTVLENVFVRGSAVCTLATARLSNGTYFLIVTDRNSSKTFKVVITQ
jgi:hypothetical protein